MLIQFKKPQCTKHRIPFEYVCRTPGCPCEIRLCFKCISEHQKRYANTEYIKQENYLKKVQIEQQIISKQYEFLKKMNLSEKQQMKSSKNIENIKLVEMIMKRLGQQKIKVFKLVEELDFNHKDTKNKLNRLKNDHTVKYLQQITKKDLLTLTINLYSPQGLHNLRIKYNRCNSVIKGFQQFIQATNQYGNNFTTFLKCLVGDQKLFLYSLQNMNSSIVKCKSRPRIFNENEGQKLKFRDKREEKYKKSKQHNRSQQILGPIPLSARKISLVTPKKRSCSSDKQN